MSSRDWDLERTIVRCEFQVYGRWIVWLVLAIVALCLVKFV